jgi:hypothetical protein
MLSEEKLPFNFFKIRNKDSRLFYLTAGYI